eukprot:SAG31_NODE_57_length_29727_cov_12.584568_12_plen_62_part_00
MSTDSSGGCGDSLHVVIVVSLCVALTAQCCLSEHELIGMSSGKRDAFFAAADLAGAIDGSS